MIEKKYYQEMYKTDEGKKRTIYDIGEEMPPLEMSEIMIAIENMKAPGEDRIITKLIKGSLWKFNKQKEIDLIWITTDRWNNNKTKKNTFDPNIGQTEFRKQYKIYTTLDYIQTLWEIKEKLKE